MTKRKIGFYYLHYRNGDEVLGVESGLVRLLQYINAQSNRAKKQDISDDRICFLDIFEYNEDSCLLKMLFKSAKHSYRAPLLNRNTVEARENPKTMEEGEQIKTHLLIKFVNGDAIVFLETGRNVLTLKIITDYLNTFISIFNNAHRRDRIEGTFSFDMIPRDDFREVLDNMERVLCAEVFIDKQVLGSDALNFSDRIEHVQDNIILEIKTERRETIKHTIYDIFSRLTGGQSVIRRIRVKGKTSDTNESIIDTSFINKKEFIDAQQNEDTGEYNTAYMFSQLELLSQDF
ncbi:MAG: hypothetical protein IJQ59_01570 [Bacteroidaceae bacterium]|nr:hypothetical protein [Bacteroidaceae bacterium]